MLLIFSLCALIFLFFIFYGYQVALFISSARAVYFIATSVGLLLILLISLFSTVKNDGISDHYYGIGHKMPGIVIGLMLAAAFQSTGLYMADAALSFNGIYGVILLTLIQSGGYFIGVAFLGRYMHRTNSATIPEYMGKRFCSKSIRRFWAVIIIAILIVYTLSVTLGLGKLLSEISSYSYSTCVVVVLSTIMLCVVMSGNRGIISVAITLWIITLLGAILNISFFVHGFGGWDKVIEAIINSEFKDYITWRGNLNFGYKSMSINYIRMLWMTALLFMTAASAPWQIQGDLIAKNENEMTNGAFFAAVGVFMVTFLALTVAVFIHVIPMEAPTLVSVVVNAPGMLMPLWASILMVLGIVSAGLSSVVVFISMISKYAAHDLFENRQKHDMQHIMIGRMIVVLATILVGAIMINRKFTIFATMIAAIELGVTCIMPALFASVWSKKVTAKGTVAGCIAGLVVLMAFAWHRYVFHVPVIIYIPRFPAGIIANFVVMMVVSRFDGPTEEQIAIRESLFVMPEENKTEEQMKETLGATKLGMWFGIIAAVLLIYFWAWPVFSAVYLNVAK